jgi:hypothetical protein
VSTIVVKCNSEVLSNRVSSMIRIYIDHMKFAAYMAYRLSHSVIFVWFHIYQCVNMYRITHKSLRHFQTLPYSSRDGHAEGEHVNGGREPASFCPT